MYYVFAIVLLIASYVITQALQPKPKGPLNSILQDIQLPTTAEGTPQGVTFGDCWTSDWTVLWYGNFGVEPISGQGGKKK